MTWRPKKDWLVTYGLAAVVLMTLAALLQGTVGAAGIFKRYVCNPIPKSVKHIRADRPWELSGHRYVMHFEISPSDLSSVLALRRFTEVSHVEYNAGSLRWDVDPSHGEALPLYRHGKGAPAWFRPNDWKNPKAYRHKERQTNYREHMQILIYNEELGEAYLIEYQEGY
jgi:hypothetical protein